MHNRWLEIEVGRTIVKRISAASLVLIVGFVGRQVCAVLYFLYVVTHPGTGVPDSTPHGSETNEESKNLPPEWTDSYKAGSAGRTSSPGGVNKLFNGRREGMTGEERWPGKDSGASRAQFSIKPPSEELWKDLYKKHWPQLLSYYDISLLGRYSMHEVLCCGSQSPLVKSATGSYLGKSSKGPLCLCGS